MRWHLMAGLVLTGCALQPVAHSPAPSAAAGSSPLPFLTLTPRVGIEYLPPLEEPRAAAEVPHALRASRATPQLSLASREASLAEGRFADLAPTLEPLRPPRRIEVSPIGGEDRTEPTPLIEPRRAEPSWRRTDAELALVEDPLERLTLSFLGNVVGTERRRVQRELGASVLFTRLRTVSTSHRLDTIVDERDREDQETLFRRYGTRLLKRPLLQTLKQNSFVGDVELALEQFKAEAFPFSEEYQESHGNHWNPGIITLRLRPGNADDPVEVLYRRRGWRIGTSQERLRLAYTMDLSAKASFSLRARYDFATDDIDMWGDLRYDPNPDTRLHVLVGRRLDLLTGTNLFPVIHSPVVLPAADDSPGLLVYVEHFF